MRLSCILVLLGLMSLACAAPGSDDEGDDDDDDGAQLCDPDAGVIIAGPCTSVVEACENYFDAVEVCYTDYGEAAGVDMSGSLLSDSYCEDTYGDVHDLEAAEYLNCLADAYNEVDCGDADAYAAIDITECTLGG